MADGVDGCMVHIQHMKEHWEYETGKIRKWTLYCITKEIALGNPYCIALGASASIFRSHWVLIIHSH